MQSIPRIGANRFLPAPPNTLPKSSVRPVFVKRVDHGNEIVVRNVVNDAMTAAGYPSSPWL